jgi:replicative DNA helicase
MTYISSGIKALDAITLGWQKSDLILIVGVPAMGNTSLMVSMLNNIAIKQI